ncbi:MAG: hypothetical protein IJ830_06395 [Alphaproteobacteria bacterium]|nr:hypothetical protein [Alphaproteobacteria bacterium]
MHYLVVAKVKDYPDGGRLGLGLLKQTCMFGDDYLEYGKWENIADEFDTYWQTSTIIVRYVFEIYKEMQSARESKKELTQEDLGKIQMKCIMSNGMWPKGKEIYAKVSGYFDYIISGGKFNMQTKKNKAKYKDVIAKYGNVDVFVLPNFECHFTKHKGVECPYKDDDKVWVFDGYSYCNW